MNIHAMTVSVNYSDLLEQTIGRWRAGVESLLVVTDYNDAETFRVAATNSAGVACTDAFYKNGAAFNKGRAMESSREFMPWKDWILFFDADILPPLDWKEQLDALDLESGWLYGCHRYTPDGARIADDCHAYGYFQLFRADDPLAGITPLLDTCWTHAGNADSFLMLRWRNAGRLAPVLPLRLVHLDGPASHNWYGRGRTQEFEAMERERRRRGGGWASIEGERLNPNS